MRVLTVYLESVQPKVVLDTFNPNGLHFRELAVVQINFACHFLRDNHGFSFKTLLNLITFYLNACVETCLQ